MRSFKNFLKEMPELAYGRRRQHLFDDDYVPIHKAGHHPDTGEYYRSFGANGNHKLYGNIESGNITRIHAVDKSSGQSHYVVDGDHDRKKNKFQVRNVDSHADRQGKYADVIDHMVSKGHVGTWESDTVHSKGSKQTYSDLVGRKHLEVRHNDKPINNHEDLENAYKSYGSFTVSKRK